MSETPNYLDIIKQVFEHKRKQFLKAEEELKQSHSSHNPAPFGALAMLATQFYSEIRTTNDVLESALKFVFKQENDMDEMATKERLSMIGRIDQSYDDLINQLVDCWEEVHNKK